MVEEGLRGDLQGRMRLWKAVGDELLFVVDVDDESEVHAFVNAWIAAMSGYEKSIGTKNREVREADASAPINAMKTKGGAFIATFPDPDYEIVVAQSPGESTSDRDPIIINERLKAEARPADLQDFLGTSIDTGFRVSNKATQRYFTLSLEVAWAYCQHLKAATNEVRTNITLLEEVSLKGVWSGRPYPILAIDRESSDVFNQAMQRLKDAEHLKVADICNLAESCHADGSWPSRIYFPSSTLKHFVAAKDLLEKAHATSSERTDRSAEGDDLRKDAADECSGDDDAANLRLYNPEHKGTDQ